MIYNGYKIKHEDGAYNVYKGGVCLTPKPLPQMQDAYNYIDKLVEIAFKWDKTKK